MTTDKEPPTPPEDTLCDHCKHQPECNEHHMMCVNFEAVTKDEKASNE